MAITAAIAVMAIVLSVSKTGCSNEVEPEHETPTPLHHLMDNSMCEYEETRRFDASINRFMRYWGIRGGSFALMRNDSLLYAKGYGFANTQDSIPCEVKNIFRVASVSKLLTAVAVMHLEETGQLSTQDFVFGEDGILNDSLFLDYRDKKIKKVTVEHLLRHTSGFSNPHGDATWSLWRSSLTSPCL